MAYHDWVTKIHIYTSTFKAFKDNKINHLPEFWTLKIKCLTFIE